MKLFHWLVTAPLALILVIFAVSNRARVTVTLWPFPFEIETRLFLVILLSLLIGLLLGLLLAWLASGATRRESRARAKRISALEREVEGLRSNRPAVSPPRSLPGAGS
ncbi:MAG TPA: lipopolysaccharide assembly protein LapA domain-containing protein [Stellaceae bacterium]|nr:lipopolysaccharide assembly protein LapA domain-containing protein [Stellaceae bacterium]